MPWTTVKAMQLLGCHGWSADLVEYFDSRTKRSHDLFGFIDIMALKPSDPCPTFALQVTSAEGGNVAAHVKKILAERRSLECLRSGWRIEVWGMRKAPVNGSGVKARTLLLNEDGSVRVVEGSLVLEAT